MQKRIAPAEVQLGMYIQKLEGGWLDHPFWRCRFLLQDIDRLDKLRNAAIDWIVIDTSKGSDVAKAPADDAADTGRLSNSLLRHRIGADLVSNQTPALKSARLSNPAASSNLRIVTSPRVSREFGCANRVIGQARKLISRAFLDARLGKVIDYAAVEPVIDDMYALVQRNPHVLNGLLRCRRDSEALYRNALAVSALMISLGRQLKLQPDELKQAGLAGLMLNIGVGYLSVDLAAQAAGHQGLTPEQLYTHVQRGRDLIIASGIDQEVAQACFEHHERMDGRGYPDQVPGSNISLLGRMAKICDTYDILVSGDVVNAGIDPATALQTMTSAECDVDAQLMPYLIEAMGVYPIGSVVLLRSGRLALVVDQSPTNRDRPCVRAFFSVSKEKLIPPVQISLADCFGEDAIERTASPEAFGLVDFSRLREKLFASS